MKSIESYISGRNNIVWREYLCANFDNHRHKIETSSKKFAISISEKETSTRCLCEFTRTVCNLIKIYLPATQIHAQKIFIYFVTAKTIFRNICFKLEINLPILNWWMRRVIFKFAYFLLCYFSIRCNRYCGERFS